MNNIFISYRRKDAATEAYLLYKDLINDGYSVFFDHKSLGEGNFRSKIQEHIRAADSFIVLLSASSFGNQIMNVEDVYRNEIKWALEYRKRIIGIMLEDFTGFPDDLPEDIAAIRNMNCLKLHIGYYEAMYGKLISGSFLPPPIAIRGADTVRCCNPDICSKGTAATVKAAHRTTNAVHTITASNHERL